MPESCHHSENPTRINHAQQPIIGWEVNRDDDNRDWELLPWVLHGGLAATRRRWPEGVEDGGIRLELTQTRPTETVARYTVGADGT